jgi:signal transduction histidine kinase
MMRIPRRTARLRLTILYGCVFLACGAALLTITYLLFKHASTTGGFPGRFAPALKAGRPIPVDQQAPGPGRQFSAPALLAVQQAYDADQLLIQSGIALAITAVAAVVLGWFVAGRALRPLSTITAAARRISASSLHERLALRGPDDELKNLSDTLDDLFARLEASFQAQRNFVANASHELRTPITRERTLLQVALADPAATTATWEAVGRELLAANTEQDGLIEALLTLASGEGGLDHWEPVDLAAVTDEVLLAQTARPDLRVRAVTQPAPLDGDPVLVEHLVANLIGNALTHNVPGGHVEIATATQEGRAILSVSNTGPEIPPGQVERLFQPFQRLGARRARRDDGHGLGLPIVRAIAAAHDAAVTARARPAGGLDITVAFPPPIGEALTDDRRGAVSSSAAG